MSELLDLLLAGVDQPQADQPNSLAEEAALPLDSLPQGLCCYPKFSMSPSIGTNSMFVMAQQSNFSSNNKASQ
eukprot:1157823-Pelagomonas_calceolata.AAC.11